MNFDPAALQNASFLAFVQVFLGGVVTSLGLCNVAAIPLIVGYVGGSRNLPRARSFVLSLAFAIGLALTFMLLGLATALTGGLRARMGLKGIPGALKGFQKLEQRSKVIEKGSSRIVIGVGLYSYGLHET